MGNRLTIGQWTPILGLLENGAAMKEHGEEHELNSTKEGRAPEVERDRRQYGHPPPIGNRFKYVSFNLELLGRVIREVRRQRGLTRKQLAGAADVSESYLGLIETGAKISGKDRNASFLVLNKIAECLSIPTHWLLLLSEEGGQESEQGQKIDAAILEVKNRIKLQIFLDSQRIEDAGELV